MVPANDPTETAYFERSNKKKGSKQIPLYDQVGVFDLFIVAYNANNKIAGPMSLKIQNNGTPPPTGGVQVSSPSPSVISPTNESWSWYQIGGDIDGESSYDYSGRSVALSADGTVLANGAVGNDENGLSSGHVRVFHKVAGDSWLQIGDDIDGENEFDSSGGSVALSSDGSVLAVGAPYNDGNGFNAGHVRVYHNVDGSWVKVGDDINGTNEVDNAGESVALSADGSVLAVGAYGNDDNNFNSGKVRIYQNSNGSWVQVGDDIGGLNACEFSGASITLSNNGSVVAIGAPYAEYGNFPAGHVRIYRNLEGTWLQVGEDVDGESDNDNAGKRVALSADGSVLAVGAPYNDGNGNWSGHVRVYQNVNGSWVKVGDDIDGERKGDQSGSSVALSDDGNMLAVGAPYHDNDSGHVRVYQNVAGFWLQIGDDIDGEDAHNYFGESVALSADGSVLAVGAYGNEGNGYFAGHVRVYQLKKIKLTLNCDVACELIVSTKYHDVIAIS